MIPKALKVMCRFDGERLELILSGEIDLNTSSELKTCLEAVPADCRDVVLDLSAVTFMDSSGIAEVLRAAQRLEPEGRSVRMRSAAPHVRRVLEVTGLTDLCLD